MDKNGPGPYYVPKGKEYCDKPNTSCWYNKHDICYNCHRAKGWRQLEGDATPSYVNQDRMPTAAEPLVPTPYTTHTIGGSAGTLTPDAALVARVTRRTPSN